MERRDPVRKTLNGLGRLAVAPFVLACTFLTTHQLQYSSTSKIRQNHPGGRKVAYPENLNVLRTSETENYYPIPLTISLI